MSVQKAIVRMKTEPLRIEDATCSLIIDEKPRGGLANMQIDEAMLISSINRGECIVRIYGWIEPTVSLGYFQKQDDEIATPLRHLPTVRRLTGGGAILHHHEITYSLAIPSNSIYHQNPSDLYRRAHRAIIGLLDECGCVARLRSDPSIQAESDPNVVESVEPFLCFLRKDPNDVVCDVSGFHDSDGHFINAAFASHIDRHQAGIKSAVFKIIGSAQRRRKGTILQHGSIVLKKSPVTRSVPGITDLFPQFDSDTFRLLLPLRLASTLASNIIRRQYYPEELLHKQ